MRCKGLDCGAEIIFVKTINGKSQVLDAKPKKGVVLVLEQDPLVLASQQDLEVDDARARVVNIWTDHHATCPNAYKFKGVAKR